MSQLMQLQIENERTFLTYKYKKVQDIDDVILQLLNEADIEGFAESHMNKAKSTVNYDVTGYRKWSEFSSDELTPEVMASAMENLYHLLAYLEDSFIDIEYVLLDKEYIYVNPGNGKLVILVVPCQAVVDEEYTLTDCVRQMFEQFTYGEGACAKQLKSCLQQEIHALETLKELADLLRAYDAEPKEPGETVSDEPAVPEETVILETIEEEADQIKTESANIAADAEYMRNQLREDMRRELEKELREQIREETRRELETELRESIRAELEEEHLYLRPRFSPGYGDFDICYQEPVVRMLNCAKTIGLTLTDSFMMTPTKSVTAVIGISTQKDRCPISGCEVCTKKDCEYRR